MSGSQLLVSVRSGAEAVSALAGGADLIDVKEPGRGPLGRADAPTIAAVVQVIDGRVPVSVALGELRDYALAGIEAEVPAGIQYAKWGLAGLSGGHWASELSDARRTMPQIDTVAVAYADWAHANAPRPNQIIALAIEAKMPAILFDTFQKDGSTLLDWMSADAIMASVRRCREAGVKVALAGSLTGAEINSLGDVRPDWFAVRGAVCEGGRRGTISERRVRELAELVHSL